LLPLSFAGRYGTIYLRRGREDGIYLAGRYEAHLSIQLYTTHLGKTLETPAGSPSVARRLSRGRSHPSRRASVSLRRSLLTRPTAHQRHYSSSRITPHPAGSRTPPLLYHYRPLLAASWICELLTRRWPAPRRTASPGHTSREASLCCTSRDARCSAQRVSVTALPTTYSIPS
jgi:hypothetical protein